MLEAAEVAGLSGQSRVHDLFIGIEGVTPYQFKTSGAMIFYGYHPSPFVIVVSRCAGKGICIKFVDEEKTLPTSTTLFPSWRGATLLHRPDLTQPFVKKIFSPAREHPEQLRLLVQGSPFQLKVWEACRIPSGWSGPSSRWLP